MDWPVAAVLLGTLATIGAAVLKLMPARGAPAKADNGRYYARATDMAEIRARLENLELAHHQLRADVRSDIKDLERTLREMLRGQES